MTKKNHDKDLLKKRAINNAICYTNSKTSSTCTIGLLHQHTLDLGTVLDKLKLSMKQINQGDLQEIEEMLFTQAMTLNVLFHHRLSQASASEFVPHIKMCSDLALRAQKEARKTLAVLVDIKNPKRATFIKQQNNAINQQVNNQIKFENQKNSANELLEVNNGQRLDSRTSIPSITVNPQMETVEISRSQNRGREENQPNERL